MYKYRIVWRRGRERGHGHCLHTLEHARNLREKLQRRYTGHGILFAIMAVEVQ